MAFNGWPEEALDFFDDLAADNTKSFWTAHKAVYDEKILRPMSELTEELAGEFGEPKIFRPYRDVRFSKDKTPYKTNIGATLGHGCYIHLAAEGLGAGAGMWQMDTEGIARYREAVHDDAKGGELEKTVAGITAAGHTVHGHGVLKSAPRGFSADHPRIELLRYKGITSWHQWPVEDWLTTAAAKDRLVEFFRASAPLNDWLARCVTVVGSLPRSVSLISPTNGVPVPGRASVRST